MNISLTGHGIELTEALRNFTEEQFAKLERHSDKITKIHVVLSTENKRQKAEANLHIARAKDIHGVSTTDDMYKSIDELVEKIERQLIKQKEKILTAKKQVSYVPLEDAEA